MLGRVAPALAQSGEGGDDAYTRNKREDGEARARDSKGGGVDTKVWLQRARKGWRREAKAMMAAAAMAAGQKKDERVEGASQAMDDDLCAPCSLDGQRRETETQEARVAESQKPAAPPPYACFPPHASTRSIQ